MIGSADKTIVIRGGTLIDGTGSPAASSDAVVISGNRIMSIGALPRGVNLDDRDRVEVIDAAGQWIMPGLIDAHVHLTFGQPGYVGVKVAKANTSPEFGALRSAMNAQQVLRAGVTSISVPGGAWFTDVAVREAINAGLIEGPRIFCAGRILCTVGAGGDREPTWVGTPRHVHSVLCDGVEALVKEVRRQAKNGVNFIKMIDSDWGDFQAFPDNELAAVVAEAHRRHLKVTIHSRGSASTRAATEAGVDWVLHADFATEDDLDAMAAAGTALMPTFTSAILALQREGGFGFYLDEEALLMRHMNACIETCRKAHARGIRLLAGSDTGNCTWMTYGMYHAKEAEIFVNEVGLSPMEAIVANTSGNALAVGLEGEVGTIAGGKLADVIVLKADPLADIRVLQEPENLAAVIKDGKPVALVSGEVSETMLHFQPVAA